MFARLSGIISSLMMLFTIFGCRSSTTIISAVVHQGARTNPKAYSSGNWTFKGIDTRIPPRIRPGFYPSATFGVPFLGPEVLGAHGYCINLSERNGIVYTCRAGHIDIGHVRKMADWTGFLSAKTLEHIEKGNTEFRFKLHEPSIYFVKLTYPENWEIYPEKEKELIAKEVSAKLGAYFAFTAGTWHEILTWFDYRPKGIESDFPSAFSWEDTYSNLLGTILAEKALLNNETDFSSAITVSLNKALKELNVQSGKSAWLAANEMRGIWFSSEFLFTTIKKKNIDIGLDDGLVTPCLGPYMLVCTNRQAQSLPVPTLDLVNKHGFSVELEIEPREWEKNKILRIAYPQKENRTNRIKPAIHLAMIMDYIKNDAISRNEGYILDDENQSPLALRFNQ